MNQQEHKKGLPFFGIGKILPFLKKFRRNLILMVTCGLMGSLVDIILPLFRRYALDHYVGNQTMDTIFLFVILYAVTVVFAGIANYISCSLATITEVSVNRDLRETAFRHLQKRDELVGYNVKHRKQCGIQRHKNQISYF